MQSDLQISSSGHRDEATSSQESLARSLKCTKCTLIFKSKVYLFEHLNKVHCLDIDASLRDAGLKYAESKKTNPETSKGSRKSFTCRSCDFKTCIRDVWTKHETQCQKPESPNLTETMIIPDSPDQDAPDSLGDQSDEAEDALCPQDLRTYKRPSQTINKYFSASSGMNDNLILDSNVKKTLISVHTAPDASHQWTSKVTKLSQIDLYNQSSVSSLQSEHLYQAKVVGSGSLEEQTNIAITEINKKTTDGNLKGPKVKKAKLKQDTFAENENISGKLAGNADFSFEVSDEDEEKKAELINRDPARSNLYFCKHCDYSNRSFNLVSSHYQSDHPYVRCNAAYIQRSADESATFRCLECPVEFLSTVDLKWHYTEKHPEAPDVFKIKLNELRLMFKCFTCTFTCNEMRVLMNHYKEKHPTCEVDNSLLFCQYLVSKCQEDLPQQETCEKASSPERSPKRTGTPYKEVEVTPSRQPQTSTVLDVTPYKCSKCEFAHKSSVVMQVHYQKKHPEQAVTIDEIKLLAKETAERMPKGEALPPKKAEVHPQENSSESLPQLIIPDASKSSLDCLRIEQVRSLEEDFKAVMSPPKPIIKKTDRLEDLEVEEKVPSQTAKYKPELALQNVSTVTLQEESSKVSKKTLDFSTPKQVKSAKDKSRAKISHSKSNSNKTKSKSDRYLLFSPLEMHYCQFCDYSNPQIRSVIGHHNAKHSGHILLSKEDIIQYSAKVIEAKRETLTSTNNHIKKSGKNNAKPQKSGAERNYLYMNPERLFYCHLCNFGNPSTQGVIAHQYRIHRYPYSSRDGVLQYTALMREKIKKSMSEGPNTAAHLPLPIINKGEKDAFFCPICNYRNKEIAVVVDHYSRVHHRISNKTSDIHLYTSKVLKQLQKPHLESAKNQNLPEKPEDKKENTNKSLKTSADPTPPLEIKVKKPRKLPCKYCSFTTQYVFLLMSHMRKIHRSKLSVTAILKLCFRKGALESGYHCEWCVFSHRKAEAVHRHYQEQHPGCKQMSLETLKARLFVGPNKLPLQDKTDSESAQENSEENEESHSCTKCSFKSNSKISLASHSKKFHSSPDKNDALDRPNDKGTSAKSQLEDLNEMPGLFESFQVPLEDVVQETSPSNVFKCTLCPATFNRKHGLSVHCGIKHLNVKKTDPADEQPEQIEGQVHVPKCPYCSYINTSSQGILTHCQMRHPTSASRVDSLHLDPAQLQDLDDYRKRLDSGETLKFSGYVCKTCPKICATLDKLDRHRAQEHNEAPKPSLRLRIKLAKHHRKSASSKASLLTNKVCVKVKCHQCPYVCSTNIRLSKHIREQHNDVAHNRCLYECTLCPNLYIYKKRLARHYVRTHGRGAYLKYFVPTYKPGPKKEDPLPHHENKSEDRRFIYMCPSCPYVNTSYHGTLTHSQMRHPSILVRAGMLKTGEIFVSNIVGCSKGKESYERGYLCKRCPEIHPSIKALKIHCQRQHGNAAVSELLAESKEHKQDSDSSPVTDDAAAPLKDTLLSSVHLQTEQGKAAASDEVSSQVAGSKADPVRNVLLKTDFFYKCQLCTYSTFSRKNLQAHYKYSHRLDALNTYKLLERYNKRKNNFLLNYFKLKARLNMKCKVCPELAFDSSQSLIDHYNSFHRLFTKTDFTVLSFGVKKQSTGLYKCKFCEVQLYGTRNLCRHLDRHRDQMKANSSNKSVSLDSSTAAPEASQQHKRTASESVKENSHTDAAPPSSRHPSPSRPPDVEPEAETQEDGYACKLCQKTFMSFKGLRSHERSHAAIGAIKKLDNVVNADIKKYLFHKPGTVKRFRCLCCAYRTNFLVLWQSHFLKNHQDVLEKEIVESSDKEEKISESADKEFLDSSEKITNLPEVNEEPEDVDESTEMYSEPPDVQRQLNHYSLMAQNVDRANMNLHEVGLSDSLLQCEMCNFNTEHLSSIRRHYANRHGKKILRCKDCDFFTGVRKNMEMHLETGHSTCQSKPTHVKDLRCPLCLYQTKNKNNMIDHIVLHREERVVPIEVRRPKLSRYLQGIVFRCHRCTFTSGSAENLRLHMTRHDDVKPYKCRLCYFDCARLTDLEAHLSDKHQVLRNHELVGQVSLDQLEARMATSAEDDDDDDYKSDNEGLDTQAMNAAPDDVSQTRSISEYCSTQILPLQEIQDTQELHEDERIPSNVSVLDVTQEVTQQVTPVLKRQEQDSQTQGKDVPLHESATEHYERNTEPNAEGRSNAEIKHGGLSFAEMADRANTNQATLTDRQRETAAVGSSSSFRMGAVQADGTDFKAKRIEPIVRGDIARNVLLLDEDGSKCKSHKSVKASPDTGAKSVDNEKNDKLLSNKVGCISLAPNLKHQGNNSVNSAQENISKHREGFKFEPHLLTLPPNYTRLRLGHRESWSRLLETCKQEQKQSPKLPEDETEPNGEKTAFKEEQPHLEQCEEEEEADQVPLKLEVNVKLSKEDCKVLDTPHVHDGLPAMDGDAEPLRDKLFTCELCGRNLLNITELNRHVMRHGV